MHFNFELSPILRRQILLLERVLSNLLRPNLEGNADFVIDYDSAGTHQLIISVDTSNRNILPIVFYFGGDGLRIDIDNIPEVFEWPGENLETHKEDIISFISDLLTCGTLIESDSKGIHITLFEKPDVIKQEFLLHSPGFLRYFSGIKVKTHLFDPLYPPQ